ncbi:hypothetical protein SFRURICE_005953 [Spodoptera frugiperda]|nr:hypothetical protein SFRURICE_005953 [Spodoptera frugiperda]
MSSVTEQRITKQNRGRATFYIIEMQRKLAIEQSLQCTLVVNCVVIVVHITARNAVYNVHCPLTFQHLRYKSHVNKLMVIYWALFETENYPVILCPIIEFNPKPLDWQSHF